jgi:hypothetical protein
MNTKRMKRIQKPITVTVPKLPDRDGTKTTIIGNRIVFVTVDHDSDCENPCTSCDGVGTVRSLSRRHINHIEYDEAKGLLEADQDVIPLSYFEHGNCAWFVMNGECSNTPGIEFQWDGVKFAGIWIPDTSVRESYTGQDGLTRRAWMVQQAESACEVYTAWVNGECYGFRVEVYKVRKDDQGEPFDSADDYRRDTPEHKDSCWGFIGWDHAKDEIKDAGVYALKALYKAQGYSKRAIAAAFVKQDGTV